jgi:hypothetical protein
MHWFEILSLEPVLYPLQLIPSFLSSISWKLPNYTSRIAQEAYHFTYTHYIHTDIKTQIHRP